MHTEDGLLAMRAKSYVSTKDNYVISGIAENLECAKNARMDIH